MFFEFFVANICHFEKNILQKIYSVTNSLLTRKDSIKKNSPKIAYNMKGCLKLFYFHILNIAQIWLNTVVINDCHLSNMTKLERKTL